MRSSIEPSMSSDDRHRLDDARMVLSVHPNGEVRFLVDLAERQHREIIELRARIDALEALGYYRTGSVS